VPFELAGRKSASKKASKEDVKELRQSFFGSECSLCGTDNKKRRVAIHRKDGRPHRSSLLWSTGNLKSLDKDE